MKALSETIIIVITAVVILVAALVLLTIFGGGVSNVGTLTQFRTQCSMQCSSTCKIGGALPPTWSIETTVGGTKTSCAKEYTSGCSDSACGGASSGSNLDSHGCYIGQGQWCEQTRTCVPLSKFSIECRVPQI